MKYFATLPSISQPDFNGNNITVTNILTRGYLLQQLQNNIYLYYDYNIKEHDKPEIISYKYYNDQNRYWMIFYANNIMDPNSEWPLDQYNFDLYIENKYKGENDTNLDTISYTKSKIHHYEQIIATYNSVDMIKSTITIEVDKLSYDNIVPKTISSRLPDNTIVYKEIDRRIVHVYDYEYSLNEKKRSIKLIKDSYAIDMDKQLSAIMS